VRRAGEMVGAIALVVTGMFCVPASAHASSSATRALRAAARRTLAAPNVRATGTTSGAPRSFEDYIAPDRVRIGGPSSIGGPPTESRIIGSVGYTQQHCNGVTSWTRQEISHPATASPNAATAEFLIGRATDVRLVAHGKHGDRYTFTIPPRTTDGGARLEWRDASAVVARGMLREFAFTARTTYQGRTTGGKGRIRFSHFGTVPPIEAPPADEVTDGPQLCAAPITGTSVPSIH